MPSPIVVVASRPYQDVWPPVKLVYLSADADVIMERFEPQCVYVIGGLVDRNRHKGVTHTKAVQQGVRTLRLPIGEASG